MSMDDWAGQTGLSQITCGCGSQTFKVITKGLTVRVVCTSCGSVSVEFEASSGMPMSMTFEQEMPGVYTMDVKADEPGLHTLPMPNPEALGIGRDRLTAGAEWTTPAGDGTDVILSGGPHDGQHVKVMADVTTYQVGPVQAGWAAEGMPPEAVNDLPGSLAVYVFDHFADHGIRVFRYAR